MIRPDTPAMTGEAAPEFTYDGGRVPPGTTHNVRYPISETYLGDPVRVPVTIITGTQPGPTAFLSAASHGDELNGIQVVREVAYEWDLAELHGTLVCLPVLNVPGFLFQQRYLPIYDRDLNRSFPGTATGTSAQRMAHQLFTTFIEPCDFGLDFHTSTRGRSNILHVRADMERAETARLAKSFGSNVIIDGRGPGGTLRREATTAGIPTITIEMGEAHRFQRELIDRALSGVESTLAAVELLPTRAVEWPGWRTVIGDERKTWLRADVGGVVEMHAQTGALLEAGEVVCTVSNPFKTEHVQIEVPFPSLLVGVLENPVAYPGNPLCHLVELDEQRRALIRAYRRESGEDGS